MKPKIRLTAIMHRHIPCIDCIRFTAYESPIDSADIFLLQHRHDELEKTAIGARHILSTDQWPSEFLQRIDGLAVRVDIFIIVIGDDVGVLELKFVQVLEIRAIVPNA